MKKTVFVFIALLCGILTVQAQDNFKPGYIITNENDTITGWINFKTDRRNQKQCDFKPDLKLATKIYLPEDIAGYRFTDEGKYYVSREIQLNEIPQKVFLEFLVKGIMNLYYYTDDIDYFFFENQDGKMEVISRQPEKRENMNAYKDYRYTGQIRLLFQDYQPIVQRADKLNFDQKSMIGVVEEYHNEVCTTGESCIIFRNEHPDDKGVRAKISVYTGLQLSNYTFYNEVFFIPTTHPVCNLSPVFGAQINLMNPRWSNSFSVQLDASLSQLKGDVPEGVRRFVHIDRRENVKQYVTEYGLLTSYQTLAVSIRLGAKYTYPKFKIAPTAEAGIAYTLLTGELAKVNALRSIFFGYYLAAGLDYKIKSSQAIFIRLVYEDYPLSAANEFYGKDKISFPHIKTGFTF